MINEVFQRNILNIRYLVGEGPIVIYSPDEHFLRDYTYFTVIYCNKLEALDIDPSLIIISDKFEYTEEFLDSLLEKDCPIITYFNNANISEYIRRSGYFLYDIYPINSKYSVVTLRPYKTTTSFLNLYMQFSENSRYQRFLDNDQCSNCMELLYNIASTFYDVKARIVYPLDVQEGSKIAGHSGCFVLGSDHMNWSTYPEQGRFDINISSSDNKILIPLIKQSFIDVFRLDAGKIYIDYKEIDVHF